MPDIGGSFIKGAFGSDKVSQQWYDKQASKNQKWLGKSFQTDDANMQGWLNDYINQNQQSMADVNRLRGLTETGYTDLLGQMNGYDPTATYERLRTGNLDALGSWAGSLEDRGRRQNDLAMAAMGLGGRPGGSYEAALRADRVSQNIAPVLGNIFSNLGSDTSSLESARQANWGNSANLLGQRMNNAFVGQDMALNPARALMAIRGGQYDQLGTAIDNARANTAGWKQERNFADRLGDGLNAGNDALWSNVNQAVNAYSSLYGGGMLGGGGGGGILGGLMGGGGQQQSSYNPYTSVTPPGQRTLFGSQDVPWLTYNTPR